MGHPSQDHWHPMRAATRSWAHPVGARPDKAQAPFGQDSSRDDGDQGGLMDTVSVDVSPARSATVPGT